MPVLHDRATSLLYSAGTGVWMMKNRPGALKNGGSWLEIFFDLAIRRQIV
jgi:hypothetical protein